jgi:hypothetical protein
MLPSILHHRLTAELLDVRLLTKQSKGNDTRDVHLRAVDVHVEIKLVTDGLDVLKTLLVVGTGTADPDLNLVLVEDDSDLTESTNDTLEGGGDLLLARLAAGIRSRHVETYVSEVGNTTTNEKNLALRMDRSAEHEVQDSLGVVVSLGLGRSTRVLSVVGELARETSRGNGISVDDGSTTTSNESPDTTLAVEDGQLERSTGLGVHLCDVGLLLAHLTAERSGELQRWASIDVDLTILGDGSGRKTQGGRRASNGPLDTAFELGSLINLGREIKEMHLG